MEASLTDEGFLPGLHVLPPLLQTSAPRSLCPSFPLSSALPSALPSPYCRDEPKPQICDAPASPPPSPSPSSSIIYLEHRGKQRQVSGYDPVSSSPTSVETSFHDCGRTVCLAPTAGSDSPLCFPSSSLCSWLPRLNWTVAQSDKQTNKQTSFYLGQIGQMCSAPV